MQRTKLAVCLGALAAMTIGLAGCGERDPGQELPGTAQGDDDDDASELDSSEESADQQQPGGTGTGDAEAGTLASSGGAAATLNPPSSGGSTTASPPAVGVGGSPGMGGAPAGVGGSATGTGGDTSSGDWTSSTGTGGSSSWGVGGSGTGGSWGGIKSGEWDDNANYREFLRYLETAPVHDVVDISNRQFIVVRDSNGSAVTNCPVVISDSAGNQADLTTYASGRTPLFPHAVGLQGAELSVQATCLEGSASGSLDASAEDQVAELRLDVPRTTLDTRPIDLVFILDVTGSMSEEIEAIKTTIAEVAIRLSPQAGIAVRIAMVTYRDYGDAFVTNVYPFSTDLTGFGASIQQVQAGGGEDTPEAVNEAVYVASELPWDSEAFARFAFLVGDAPPHANEQYSCMAEAMGLHERGIKLFTVSASGQDATGQAIFRQLAQYTYATNLFILEGGAGPTSTGGGEPTTSCGETQVEYTTGQLHELIVDKVLNELELYDSDPMQIPGLGEDVQPDPCVEENLGGAGGAAGDEGGAGGGGNEDVIAGGGASPGGSAGSAG